MKRRELERLDGELSLFLDGLSECVKRKDQRRSFVMYVTGLLLDGERKSLQPMAMRLVDSADEHESMRQRLQQVVSAAPWDEAELYRALAVKLDTELPGVSALVVDDTGFPKKGIYSVGVHRQYSGTLGRVENCQVAASLHLAGEGTSGCIGLRLFLPETWANDADRRKTAGVPENVIFKKKWELAIDLIDNALAAGVRKHIVLADAGYGDATEFRAALSERGLRYLVGVQSKHCVWPPESQPALPDQEGKPGRRATRHRDDEHPALSIADLAAKLDYRKVTWRDGSKGVQSSRFAAVRVRSAERRTKGGVPGEPEWLLCEWPAGEPAPTKFYLSSLPANTSVKALVRAAKLRWRVERDYQEMKQEIGLDHFEGRTWRGFHHHAALCAVAHAFLALQRALFPPEEVDAA
jgi:SRSO17 transposase